LEREGGGKGGEGGKKGGGLTLPRAPRVIRPAVFAEMFQHFILQVTMVFRNNIAKL